MSCSRVLSLVGRGRFWRYEVFRWGIIVPGCERGKRSESMGDVTKISPV